MKKTKLDDPLYKQARSDARRDHRRDYYGEKREVKRQERLGGKPDTILKGERRKAVVSAVMDELRDWRSSPFENEGHMIAGLRSVFCLDGRSWVRSDNEAAAIVGEGLRFLGANRPTWDEGQREFSTPAEHCTWCSRPLDVALIASSRKYRYCDEACAASALRSRGHETTVAASKMHLAAHEAIRRARKPARACSNPACGKAFHSEIRRAKYCSRECALAVRRVHPNPKRKCEGCWTMFRTDDPSAKFCSKKCLNKYGWRPKLRTVCDWCDKVFLAKFETARYCCASHRQLAAMWRSGIWVPKKLTAPVFDQVFTIPFNSRRLRADNLTAEVFDGWFQEAA